MECSITFSNKFSYLSSICAECDLPSCVCNSNSQSNETEDIYLVRNNVLNQMSSYLLYLLGKTLFLRIMMKAGA